MKKGFKEMAAKLGLKRIGDSDYYESEPDEHGKVTIAYHDGCEFRKIGEYANGNKRMIALHISSLDAVYLSYIEGQFLICQDGVILSASRDFARINCIKEPAISKNIALLNVFNASERENVAIVKNMGNGEYKWGTAVSRWQWRGQNQGLFLRGSGDDERVARDGIPSEGG